MKPRVLILGGYGMLGHRLWSRCRQQFDTCATVRTLRSGVNDFRVETIAGVSAAQLDTVRQAFDRAQPDVVVNCIGIVKQRESGAVEMLRVNALFPNQLADLCKSRGARLIHLSTDCVFSGKQCNRSESDAPDATDLYGGSKRLGEVANEKCLTIRTSMIGRETGTKYGLLEWFLANSDRPVPGYTNAYFSGLTTDALSCVIAEIIEHHPGLAGIWHVAGPRISKHDLLCILREAFGTIAPILPDSSVRIDRSLNGDAFRRQTGWTAPTWSEMIAALAPAAELTGATQ